MKRVGEGENLSFTKRISINKSKLLAAEIIFDPDDYSVASSFSYGCSCEGLVSA